MSRFARIPFFGLALIVFAASSVQAQDQYIGYVYPAGGQQGSTFPIKLGGQRLKFASDLVVSGEGVTVRLVDYHRVLDNQELDLVRQQLRELQKEGATIDDVMASKMAWFEFPATIGPETKLPAVQAGDENEPGPTENEIGKQKLIERIERIFAEDERNPAVRAHTEIVFAEVSVAADAKPGRREIRVITKQGISNALPFYIDQVPEVARKPMKNSQVQVLGKEHLALRKRPAEEVEMRISVPCTMNGQIGAGEVNQYRFQATKGQRLVIAAKARQLIPYVADGVPGWFQAVLRLHDADGNEVAYNDDFRFDPDPVIYFEVPNDGEYQLTINEALFRGRESFTYRITIGELPYLTSLFPLGGRVGEPIEIEMDGWNLEKTTLSPPPSDAKPGQHLITATDGKLVSNSLPFVLDTLPETFDQEPNNHLSEAQKVTLPIIVNGRADRPGDWDVFEVEGKAGEEIVAEVHARRLGSPFDSFIKFTDAGGNVIALNDDHYDAASGLNTDHADSYLMVTLPADGKYYVHLGDARRHAGQAYAYRLRISRPQPDFELRVIPSRVVMRGNASASMTVYAIRKDGFNGPIKLSFQDLPEGFESAGATLPANQDIVKLSLKNSLAELDSPVGLTLIGTATVGSDEIVRSAIAAEDRMQAFLWRHLQPADDLPALVFNPSYQPPADRIRPPIRAEDRPKDVARNLPQSSVNRYLGQIEALYQQWLFTDEFANRQIANIEARLIK